MARRLFVLISLLVATVIEARHLEKRQARPPSPNGGSNNCPRGPNVAFANSNDCSSFFECNTNGDRIEKQCALGTEFSEAVGRCDWPSANPTCRRTVAQDIKQELSALCGSNPTGNQSQAFLVPHPQICNAFFACSPNHIHNSCYFCGEGLYFAQGGTSCSANPNQQPQQFCQGGRKYVAHREITKMKASRQCSIYQPDQQSSRV